METRSAPAYEEDFAAWLEDQAQRARRGETDGLDLENIAEELEGMARGDRREIRNRLTVLLIFLLKHMVQPRRRSSGWIGPIGEQRMRIATVITTAQACDRFLPRYWTSATPTRGLGLPTRLDCRQAPFPNAVPSL